MGIPMSLRHMRAGSECIITRRTEPPPNRRTVALSGIIYPGGPEGLRSSHIGAHMLFGG